MGQVQARSPRHPNGSATRRDPVAEILDFNEGRDPERLSLKYRAMRGNAFAFLRGTCHLYYRDLWREPLPFRSPTTWISGDLHLENFGSFKGDNRLTYFDVNDFDEAALAPCAWDLARFLASVLIGAETLGLHASQALTLCHRFLNTYAGALRDGKARWIERATAEGMVKDLLRAVRKRKRADLIEGRTRKAPNGARALLIDGERALKASQDNRAKVVAALREFARHQADPKFFRIIDVARRIAGTGSLGIERYAILVQGRGSPDGNFLLDLKHQPGAASRPYLRRHSKPVWTSEAQRVVVVQHRMQAISPAFLTSLEIGSRSYVLRELMPSEHRLQLAHWNGKLRRLEKVMDSMGHIVAWDQLRACARQGSASADELIAFGQDPRWRVLLLEWVRRYARQTLLDWRAYCKAYDQGAFAAPPR